MLLSVGSKWGWNLDFLGTKHCHKHGSMTKKGIATLRTLVVEDNSTDALLLKGALEQVPGVVFETTRVERLRDALAHLNATQFDLVLMDLNLPDSQPADTLTRLRQYQPEVPVVVLTGCDDEALGIKALQMGAQDYLVKGQCSPALLGRSVRYAVERHQSALALRESEARRREAQKLESMGLLPGGIAHDFNNILTVVKGNLSLVLDDLGPQSELKGFIESATESTDHAARLIRQFLAYAGKGTITRTPLSVTQVAEKTVQLLQSSVPENVELRTDLAPNLSPVIMDPRQLDHILTNLITNAIEGIGQKPSGLVIVATRPCNRFVSLTVSDTGCGMDKETQKRIFEPFFTTKSTGRGLGLAAVDGIVRSLNGHIFVESAVGRGTEIEILLPAGDAKTLSAGNGETELPHLASR